VEAQCGISVGGKISMDQCGSRYCTYRNVKMILGKVRLEGE